MQTAFTGRYGLGVQLSIHCSRSLWVWRFSRTLTAFLAANKDDGALPMFIAFGACDLALW
jgi:hypothetical protein